VEEIGDGRPLNLSIPQLRVMLSSLEAQIVDNADRAFEFLTQDTIPPQEILGWHFALKERTVPIMARIQELEVQSGDDIAMYESVVDRADYFSYNTPSPATRLYKLQAMRPQGRAPSLQPPEDYEDEYGELEPPPGSEDYEESMMNIIPQPSEVYEDDSDECVPKVEPEDFDGQFVEYRETATPDNWGSEREPSESATPTKYGTSIARFQDYFPFSNRSRRENPLRR
jgi:hypothetical protein